MLRQQVPHLSDDRHFHPDIQSAIRLVRDGAILQQLNGVVLPKVARI